MIEERSDYLARHRRRISPKNCSKAVLLQDPASLQQTTALPSPHIRKRKSSLGGLRTPIKASISPLHASKHQPTSAKSTLPGYRTFTEFASQSKGCRTHTRENNSAMGRRRSSPDMNQGLAAVLSLCDNFCDLPRPRKYGTCSESQVRKEMHTLTAYLEVLPQFPGSRVQ